MTDIEYREHIISKDTHRDNSYMFYGPLGADGGYGSIEACQSVIDDIHIKHEAKQEKEFHEKAREDRRLRRRFDAVTNKQSECKN